MTPIFHRLKHAWGILTRGSIAPFDRIQDFASMGGEKLTHPYANSVWVMRAIKKISGPISAVPINFSIQTTTGDDQAYQDPAILTWWRSPFTGLTVSDGIEATVGWLKLAGEIFWLLDDSWLTPFPTSRPPILIARPDRMRAIIVGGQLVGWSYTDAAGHATSLLPEQVIQLKNWNPYDPHRGLAEWIAASTAAEADYLAGKFNLNLMRNNGDQGPYIIAKGGIPDDTQREQIVAQLREKKELSSRGIFKPMFISGDIAVEDPKVSTPDANFAATRLQNRHEIFIAFGVPPSMADVQASYSIGSASDRYALIEETCMPTAAKIAAAIDQVILRQTGKPITTAFVWDEHSTMQAVRRERIDAALKLWATGMPMSEVNDYLQLGMPEYPGWDTGYLPFSVTPVGTPPPDKDPAFSDDQSAQSNPSDQSALQEMHRALTAATMGLVRQKAEGRMQKAETPAPAPAVDHEFSTSCRAPSDLALWRSHMAKRRGTIKAYENGFNKALMAARAEVLKKLAAKKTLKSFADLPDPSDPSTRAAAADFLFDLSSFERTLLANLRKVGASALQDAGLQLLAEIGKADDPWSMTPTEVLDFLKSRENKIVGAAQETFDSLKSSIEEGLNGGETIDELSDRVREKFNEMSDGRARRIAMTETAAAYGKGRDVAMRDAGVQFKRWLTSGNDNVRPAHFQANNQTVPITERFIVGGEKLQHPGDPDGSPGNVINCHCVSIAVAPPSDKSYSSDPSNPSDNPPHP